MIHVERAEQKDERGNIKIKNNIYLLNTKKIYCKQNILELAFCWLHFTKNFGPSVSWSVCWQDISKNQNETVWKFGLLAKGKGIPLNWLVTEVKVQVLTMTLLYLDVKMSQLKQNQDPKTEAAKWKWAIFSLIFSMSAFPTVKFQIVFNEKGLLSC